MVLVTLRLSLAIELSPGVVTVGAHRDLELGLVVSAFGCVGLSVVTPDGTS